MDRLKLQQSPHRKRFSAIAGRRRYLEARAAVHFDRPKAGLTALGLTYTAAEGHQLPQLNAVRIPAGVDDLAVRKQLLNNFGIEIGGG